MSCNSTYCINNTGLVGADDSYITGGTYNGDTYWTGQTSGWTIYYSTGTTSQWCLSDTLGGPCYLTGKSPCSSLCPDLSSFYVFSGACPTPTPTPSQNCDVLDFTAMFDCDFIPTQTPTPTSSVTPTPTITPSSTNFCSIIGIDASGYTYTLTPTPTPTVTPTEFNGNNRNAARKFYSKDIVRNCDASGLAIFTAIEGQIICPGTQPTQPTQTPTQTPTPTPTPTKIPGASQTPTQTPTPTITPTSSTPSYGETFTMIARSLNSITIVSGVGFRVTASLPFRVVWGDGNTTNYPAGTNYISHTYSPAHTGNILIQSSDLTSITYLGPQNVTPLMSQTTTRYLEIQTSELNRLDGLLIMGDGDNATYFTSGDISLLPSTLTTFKSRYSNCSGDIANLPPNLQTLSVNAFGSNANQSNTILGDISNLPPSLTEITLGGNNTLSGSISDSPSLLQYIAIDGLNIITGDVSSMNTPNLLIFTLYGNNSVFGDLGGLSNSVTQIRLQGYSTVTGDISTLPPNLTTIIVDEIPPAGNTLYGDIGTLNYSTLTTISIQGNNQISGNISSINLKAGASLGIDGENTITGDIGTLGNSFAFSTINILGNNTIYGNIQDLPSNARRIGIYGQNTISGDLSLINLNQTLLYVYGNNTISGFTDNTRIFTGLNQIEIIGSGFNSTNLNKLLTSYANSTWSGFIRLLKLNGTSTPTYTNTTSYNILTGSTKNVLITIS